MKKNKFKIAKIYAGALYSSLIISNDLEVAENDIGVLHEIIDKTKELIGSAYKAHIKTWLNSPSFLEVIKSSEVKNFIKILIINSREDILESCIIEYNAIKKRNSKQIDVSIIFANEADTKHLESIKSNLENKLGKKIICDISFDPSIMGGYIIKYGSYLLDCSILEAISKIRNNASVNLIKI